MSAIADRLRHAVVTATNDDYSEVGSEKRQRHIDRLTAMQNAHEKIVRMESALVQIRAVCEDNPNAATNFIDEVACGALLETR